MIYETGGYSPGGSCGCSATAAYVASHPEAGAYVDEVSFFGKKWKKRWKRLGKNLEGVGRVALPAVAGLVTGGAAGGLLPGLLGGIFGGGAQAGSGLLPGGPTLPFQSPGLDGWLRGLGDGQMGPPPPPPPRDAPVHGPPVFAPANFGGVSMPLVLGGAGLLLFLMSKR